MKKIVFILLVLSVSGFVAAEDKSALTVQKGKSLYVNEYLGMSVRKPDGWYSQSAEELIMLQNRGKDVLAGDNKNFKALIETSIESSLPVFGFFRYPPGTPGKLNQSVLSTAENIKMFPGIKTGCDYLHHAKRLISQGKVAYTFTEGCHEKAFGNRKLGYIDASASFGKQKIKQRYYSTIIGHHAVSIIETYFDEESKRSVNDIVKTLKFTK